VLFSWSVLISGINPCGNNGEEFEIASSFSLEDRSFLIFDTKKSIKLFWLAFCISGRLMQVAFKFGVREVAYSLWTVLAEFSSKPCKFRRTSFKSQKALSIALNEDLRDDELVEDSPSLRKYPTSVRWNLSQAPTVSERRRINSLNSVTTSVLHREKSSTSCLVLGSLDDSGNTRFVLDRFVQMSVNLR